MGVRNGGKGRAMRDLRTLPRAGTTADWKIESAFSAPSLYLLGTLFFCCFFDSSAPLAGKCTSKRY